MRLLAVDTTSRAGSAAIVEGHELQGLVGFSTAPGHAETLLPTIDTLLEGCAVKLPQIDAFAVATGPGSFTGLRIGIATVEGLAFSTRRPVVGVSTLEATAHRYRLRTGLVASFLDASRGEVFGALYRSDGYRLEGVIEPVCEVPEQFLARFPPGEIVLVAGSGISRYREKLEAAPRGRLQLADPSPFLSEEVARIGLRLLRDGKDVPLGGLQAVYLRSPDAETAPAPQPSRAQR